MSDRWSLASRAAALPLAVCLGLAGCASYPPDGVPGRAEDGPLQVSGGSGGAMILAAMAGGGNRRAVFGGLDLCTTGGPVTLEDVRYRTAGGAATWRPVLRRVPRYADRTDRPDSVFWAPLSAWRGDIDGPHAARRVPGVLDHDVPGTVVEDLCGPPDPADAATELLTSVVAATDRGARVRDLVVHYRADGNAYLVAVPWEMTLCGDRGDYPDC